MEERVRLIDDHNHQRPRGARPEVPGVGHAEDLGDGDLPVKHQLVDLPQHLADLVQVIFGGQPGAGHQPVVVGAALAVHEDELDGVGGGELAEEVGDEHGLAEPGQPGDYDAGDLGRADEDGGAVLGPPSHHDSSDAGAAPGRSTWAGASRGSWRRPRSRISPGACCSARTATQPQVSAR
jgi:hypothetical protein